MGIGNKFFTAKGGQALEQEVVESLSPRSGTWGHGLVVGLSVLG